MKRARAHGRCRNKRRSIGGRYVANKGSSSITTGDLFDRRTHLEMMTNSEVSSSRKSGSIRLGSSRPAAVEEIQHDEEHHDKKAAPPEHQYAGSSVKVATLRSLSSGTITRAGSSPLGEGWKDRSRRGATSSANASAGGNFRCGRQEYESQSVRRSVSCHDGVAR